MPPKRRRSKQASADVVELLESDSGSDDVQLVAEKQAGPSQKPPVAKHQPASQETSDKLQLLLANWQHNPQSTTLADLVSALHCPCCSKPLPYAEVSAALSPHQFDALLHLAATLLSTAAAINSNSATADASGPSVRPTPPGPATKPTSSALPTTARSKLSASKSKPTNLQSGASVPRSQNTQPTAPTSLSNTIPRAARLPISLLKEVAALRTCLLSDPSKQPAAGIVDDLEDQPSARKTRSASKPKAPKPPAPTPPAAKRRKSSSGHNGVGYGGDQNELKTQDLKAAAKRQARNMQQVTAHLASIRSMLPNGPSPTSALPFLLAAACRQGRLLYCLRLVLQSISFTCMEEQHGMCLELCQLLRLIAGSLDLHDLLYQPAEDPDDPALKPNFSAPLAPSSHPGPSTSSAPSSYMRRLYQPMAAALKSLKGSADAGPSSSSQPSTSHAHASTAPSLAHLLRELRKQYAIYLTVAEQLESEDDGGIEQQLSAALACETVYELLKDSHTAPASGAGQSRQLQQQQLSGQQQPRLSGQGQRQPIGGQQQQQIGGQQHKRRSRGDGGSSKHDQGSSSADLEQEYVRTMQPLLFQTVDLLSSHHFKQAAEKQAAGGELMRSRLKRITTEIGALSTSLPLSRNSSIFLAMDTNRCDVLRALIFPSEDTPYANGAFIFDIYLPHDYPNAPPQVHLCTTGGGRVRFNPNLYECGKVCLSLLGTWQGPGWDPKNSTLLQVLVSIQSMIFVPDPYYNEPGFGPNKKAAADYAANVQANTLEHAILPALLGNTVGGQAFQEVIRAHYRLKRQQLLEQCDQCAAAHAGLGTHGMVQRSVQKIKAAQAGV